MAQELQDHYDELIPFAADRGNQFLGVIKQRAEAEGLPVVLAARQERKSGRLVLEGKIQVGSGLSKASPTTLTVFADAIGSSLQVGWQLSTEGIPAFMMGFESMQHAQASRERRDARPENVRAMSGIVLAFHQAVFLPVMGLLTEAIERSRATQERGGFLGA